MVEYNIVKHCKRCGVRFLVGKGQSKQYYCQECYQKILKERKEKEHREQTEEEK